MDADRNIVVLNELIAVVTDVAASFHEFSECAISSELRSLIEAFAPDWETVLTALRAEIIYLDGAPELQTTLVGDTKRALSKIKAGMSKNEDRAVAKHLVSLGERTVRKFSQALDDSSLTPKVKSIVQLQHGRVSDIHQRVQAISDELIDRR